MVTGKRKERTFQQLTVLTGALRDEQDEGVLIIDLLLQLLHLDLIQLGVLPRDHLYSIRTAAHRKAYGKDGQ